MLPYEVKRTSLETLGTPRTKVMMNLANPEEAFSLSFIPNPRYQAEMENHGLRRGENGLEIYVMCEIPGNVILAHEFAEIFDGQRQ